MKGPTHKLIGVTTAVAMTDALDLGVVLGAGLVATAYWGSRLPDQLEGGILPHRGPTHKVWAGLLVAGAIVAAITWLWGLAIGRLRVETRPLGLRHSFWSPVLEFGYTVAAVVGAGILVGYIMHLVADGCTRKGLEVAGHTVHLLPKSLRIKTGSATEGLLAFVVAIGLVGYMAMSVRGLA